MNEFSAPAPVPPQRLLASSSESTGNPQGQINGLPATNALPRPAAKLNDNRKTGNPRGAFLLPRESFSAVYSSEEKEALNKLVTFVDPEPKVSPWSRPPGDFSEVEALFTGWDSPRLDPSLLALFPSLRIVFHAGGSVKFLATDRMWERGIRLTSAARANAVPVAEYTIAHIILSLKQVFQNTKAARDARRFVRNDATMPTCYGSVVGIISAGLIGRMVAERLRTLDVRVLCHDPFLSANDAQALGVEACSLDELFARSDVVTCHTPLLPETTHLVRERHFASMKPGATFINTARGAIVHEPEMIAVLKRRSDFFAILDVTDPEPPLVNSPLFDLPNVMLTPHISGSVGPECRRMGRMMVDEVRRFFANEPLHGEILRENLPKLA